RDQAKDLRAALDPQAKVKLEQELAALRSRVQLGKQLAEVEQFVEDSKAHNHLTACHGGLNPKTVSRQMTKLAGIYVTDALADGMNEELAKLGRRRSVEPELVGRTDVGKTMMALKVVDCDDPASQVLSEGEQRAMSLALFLAEMGGTVAQTGQPVLFQTVSWSEGQGPGFVTPGLTWETMDTAARLSQVRDLGAALKGVGDYLDEPAKERVKLAYTKLRGTIERAVREVFLNNTVQPFSDVVSVESFGAVVGFPQDQWEELTRIYDRCCEVTDAHDTNAAHQLPIPHPDELLKDINVFDGLLVAARRRGSAYRGERQKRNEARKKVFTANAEPRS